MQIANANPPVQITGRHVQITDAIRDFATSKVAHLHLDYPRIIEAHLILNVEKHRHTAELILSCNNHISIEASAETTDLYASIDEVMAKVAQQMRKYKTRISRHHRPRPHEVQHVEEQVFGLEGFHEDEKEEPSAIMTEKYEMKPMFVDEAILQLEMAVRRQFLVFLNARTEKVNVLYRRADGHLGLIEPMAA